MKQIDFPPVEFADPHTGLLARGADFEAPTLLSAYRQGIFPWPRHENEILWFSPPKRAILVFNEFHIPKRLKQYLKKKSFHFRVNHNFKAVIESCAEYENRPNQDGTWITADLMNGYKQLHQLGYAFSFESYSKEGSLVGGLYGVKIGRYFSAESMFYRESFASQFVLIGMVNYLSQLGLKWMDIQVLTPHMQRFGAREIPRKYFLALLEQSLEN